MCVAKPALAVRGYGRVLSPGSWKPIDAQQEAADFGCSVAAQLGFIREAAQRFVSTRTASGSPAPAASVFKAEAAASKDPSGLEAVIRPE